VTAQDAVALGINAMVAFFAMERSHARAGERVLVRGASGGIGVIAVQLAAHKRCEVTALTSSTQRGDRLKELGATITPNRLSTDIEDLPECDIVVDTVAGNEAGEFIDRLGLNGRYVLCGGAGGAPPVDFGTHLLRSFQKSPTFYELSLNSFGVDDMKMASSQLFDQAARGEVICVVDEVLPLERAIDAHLRLENGDSFGKVILTTFSTASR
jgi:NADPH2:quinone reductase